MEIEIEASDIIGDFGVSSELEAQMILEPPYLLYLQGLNTVLCKISGEAGEIDYLRPLTVNGIWSHIDLMHSRESRDEVIGFNLMHLASATYLLPRIFNLYRSKDITLFQVVGAVSDIYRKAFGYKNVFGAHQKIFTKFPLSQELKLTTFILGENCRRFEVSHIVVTRESLLGFSIPQLS